MRRIPIPNNNSPNEYGVELDKTLSDGSKALGLVRITDQPSPYKPDEILILTEAWQITSDGRPVAAQPSPGQSRRVAIRPLYVSIPRNEYTHVEAEKQIDLAAAALQQIAGDIPEPVSLPNPKGDIASPVLPEQLPGTPSQ